jgi:iron complex outermembrane recepter protein
MRERSFYVIFTSILVFTFVFGEAIYAYAQETAVDEFTLEEITVTAQKRVENQQKVPIAMDVISSATLEGSGQDNVDEILQNLSNSMVNMASDGMRVTLRGLSDTTEAWNNMRVSTPTVAINVDGAYNTGDTAGQNLFDLERVEVLYGPQSTLYGSNSPGGIVNIVTASPKTDKYSASGAVEYGSYDKQSYQTSFNAPIISDKLAMRLAAQKSKQGSVIDGGDNSSDNTSVRFKTLYQATDKLSATLTGTWSASTSGGMTGGNVKPFDYQDGHYSDGSEVKNPWTTSTSTMATGGGGDQHTKGLSGEISWDTPIGGLSIVPSWSKSYSNDKSNSTYADRSTNPSTEYDADETRENSTIQKNAEVRLTNPKDFFFTWIVGATYYKSERLNYTGYEYYNSADELTYSYTKQTSNETNKGLYGNATYPVTEKFRVTLGFRQSWDDVSMEESGSQTGTGGQEFSKPDVKYGVEYDASENLMVYGSYSTSYRVNNDAGIARGTSTITRDIPAERMKAFTLGSKSRLFENKMQVNTSAYYYDYKHKKFTIGNGGQLEGFNTAVDETAYNVDFNTDGDTADTEVTGMIEDPWRDQYGSFRSIGVDVSASWIITNADKLNLSVSYLNAKWKDATVHYYWSQLAGVMDGWEDEGRDLSGMKNSYSPAWSGTISYQHNIILGDLGILVPQLDLQFKSSYRLSLQTEQSLIDSNYDPKVNYQEAYHLLNGSVAFNHSSGIWNLNVYIKNATNYAVKTYINENGNNLTLGLNDPRTYGAVLSVKF